MNTTSFMDFCTTFRTCLVADDWHWRLLLWRTTCSGKVHCVVDLQMELRSLRRLVKDTDGPLDILGYKKNWLMHLWHCAYVYSPSWRSSKHLRSTMSEECLSGFAMVSIKNDICKYLPNNDIIDQFAATRAWKVPFS